jgi:trehalose-6-phosphate synthase
VLRIEHHDAAQVYELYRASDVCYVSSLHDGMNLVAKEFVASRDDEQGVLILSQFTGAARELSEALIVNPYDIEQSAVAMHVALTMPPAERTGRMLLDAARMRHRRRVVSQSRESRRGAVRPA